MKLIIVGSEEECLGFSLAGVEGTVVNDDDMFVEAMKQLLDDHDIGVIAITDRYFTLFSEHFNSVIEKRAIPAIVFIPSIDGIHHESSLKEYLANILGIRL